MSRTRPVRRPGPPRFHVFVVNPLRLGVLALKKIRRVVDNTPHPLRQFNAKAQGRKGRSAPSF